MSIFRNNKQLYIIYTAVLHETICNYILWFFILLIHVDGILDGTIQT